MFARHIDEATQGIATQGIPTRLLATRQAPHKSYQRAYVLSFLGMSTRLLTAAATASHIKEPTDWYSEATASKAFAFQRGNHTYGPTATHKYAK